MEGMMSNLYVIKGIQSVGLALVVFVLARIALSVASKNGKRSSEAPYAIKFSAICFFAVALVLIWLESIGPILAALTIVAAALTIVSKELILNFLGSFVIFWRNLFAIGDRVQVGDFSGDVIDKGILYFTLLEVGTAGSTGHSTGRLIKIPNAMALTLPVINSTRGAGYVWHEIQIAITRESDWEAAKNVLLSAVERYYEQEKVDLNRIKRDFEKKRIYFKKLTPRVYMDITTGGIHVTVRYLCKSRLVREGHDFMISTFLHEMKQVNVELADMQSSLLSS